jgi:hypothetical protein
LNAKNKKKNKREKENREKENRNKSIYIKFDSNKIFKIRFL